MKTPLKKEPRPRVTARKHKLIIGVVAAVFLLATPFLFYSYRLIPVSLTEVEILGTTIRAGAHGNLNYYAYYFFTKLVIAMAFVVWFLTCRDWWRWAILVPICMLVFQIIGIVNTSVDYIDEFDFWYSLPIVLPIALILILLSKRLSFYTSALDLRDEIDEEISKLQ